MSGIIRRDERTAPCWNYFHGKNGGWYWNDDDAMHVQPAVGFKRRIY